MVISQRHSDFPRLLKLPLFLGAVVVLLSTHSPTLAGVISLGPDYGEGSFEDFTTGDNFVSGKGWYVDPGADSHIDDPVRERPLSTNSFSRDSGSGQWVHPGTYYAFLDIKSASWGFDDQYLYFQITLFGKGSKNDFNSDWDFGTFGSGTTYNILFGQHVDGEANSSVMLRVLGDTKETWTGPTGDFFSKAAEAYWDKNGDVGDDGGITTTKEGADDDGGNGYDETVVSSDGKLGGSGPEVLFSRLYPGPDSESTMPTVEIALDYAAWNLLATGLNRPVIDPSAISFLVFEANRGTKDRANYLWNDKWTLFEEGSPYDEFGIKQFNNVYELDRLRGTFDDGGGGGDVVPEPASLVTWSVLGLVGMAFGRRRARRKPD